MTLMMIPPTTAAHRTAADARNDPAAWPAEMEFIMSALEAARGGAPERRSAGRMVHRCLAHLRLFSDTRHAAPWSLYTRDATARSMGFITRHRLPLGYGGVVTLTGPDGRELSIECTVRRCRETVQGWFEGSLSFNREQFAFDPHSDQTGEEQTAPAGCIFREAKR